MKRMPKEDKLKEVRDLMERLSPVERRNFVLIAKAKQKYGSKGTEAASKILRMTPEISEEEFWEFIGGLVAGSPLGPRILRKRNE
jgi:hypothetical protein